MFSSISPNSQKAIKLEWPFGLTVVLVVYKM